MGAYVSLAALAIQIVFLGVILGYVGWKLRNFLNDRSVSRQYDRKNATQTSLQAKMAAFEKRQATNRFSA